MNTFYSKTVNDSDIYAAVREAREHNSKTGELSCAVCGAVTIAVFKPFDAITPIEQQIYNATH